ncbi:Uncharacterised protein [Staphylococcus aureus]|uniref:hypothetical protein n=1 Tax=Staphylococcus aureus TaxID=1280 RepID=UPI000769562F|nr:hypothetical protein [Staphylococcus aureus]CXO62453.1 Uncharacterised protein [Staphylococcus aureus]
MNNINDRDLTELSGYWVYQDIKDGSKFRVVNSGLKMLFYGGLKMSFFSGLRLSYI